MSKEVDFSMIGGCWGEDLIVVAGVWILCKITKIGELFKMGWESAGEVQTGLD